MSRTIERKILLEAKALSHRMQLASDIKPRGGGAYVSVNLDSYFIVSAGTICSSRGPMNSTPLSSEQASAAGLMNYFSKTPGLAGERFKIAIR